MQITPTIGTVGSTMTDKKDGRNGVTEIPPVREMPEPHIKEPDAPMIPPMPAPPVRPVGPDITEPPPSPVENPTGKRSTYRY